MEALIPLTNVQNADEDLVASYHYLGGCQRGATAVAVVEHWLRCFTLKNGLIKRVADKICQLARC